MDFGDGLAPMELPSLKNRRAALAKRAGFGAVRLVNPLKKSHFYQRATLINGQWLQKDGWGA